MRSVLAAAALVAAASIVQASPNCTSDFSAVDKSQTLFATSPYSLYTPNIEPVCGQQPFTGVGNTCVVDCIYGYKQTGSSIWCKADGMNVGAQTCELETQATVKLLPYDGDNNWQFTKNGVPSRGIVSLLYNGVWGGVCFASDFTTNAAKVVCKQLGWTADSTGAPDGLVFGPSYHVKDRSASAQYGRFPNHLSGVICDAGTEENLDACHHNHWRDVSSYCDTHAFDVVVDCFTPSYLQQNAPPAATVTSGAVPSITLAFDDVLMTPGSTGNNLQVVINPALANDASAPITGTLACDNGVALSPFGNFSIAAGAYYAEVTYTAPTVDNNSGVTLTCTLSGLTNVPATYNVASAIKTLTASVPVKYQLSTSGTSETFYPGQTFSVNVQSQTGPVSTNTVVSYNCKQAGTTVTGGSGTITINAPVIPTAQGAVSKAFAISNGASATFTVPDTVTMDNIVCSFAWVSGDNTYSAALADVVATRLAYPVYLNDEFPSNLITGASWTFTLRTLGAVSTTDLSLTFSCDNSALQVNNGATASSTVIITTGTSSVDVRVAVLATASAVAKVSCSFTYLSGDKNFAKTDFSVASVSFKVTDASCLSCSGLPSAASTQATVSVFALLVAAILALVQ